MISFQPTQNMDNEAIRLHWQSWAREHGASLRATTKTATAKYLELDALARAFRRIINDHPPAKSVLEVGCGNGENLLHLAETFPHLRFTGMDFIPEMIAAAKGRGQERGLSDRIRYLQGDVLNLPADLDARYDIIFTDRCIINLNTADRQKSALSGLCARLPVGGYLVMIENNTKTYAKQNHARELLGLPARQPAEFNCFLDEASTLRHLDERCGMQTLDVEDFISLHDLALYVLVPAINGGAVDYDHPLVHAATKLSLAASAEQPGTFGDFGQNRLYLCRKIRDAARPLG
jgi:SAM-dependent methyltransferase